MTDDVTGLVERLESTAAALELAPMWPLAATTAVAIADDLRALLSECTRLQSALAAADGLRASMTMVLTATQAGLAAETARAERVETERDDARTSLERTARDRDEWMDWAKRHAEASRRDSGAPIAGPIRARALQDTAPGEVDRG